LDRALTLHLWYIGKPRDPHANAIAQEFIKRTSRYAKCEMREIHPGRTDLWSRNGAKILLDPAGRPLDSAGFAALVRRMELEARDAYFVVGGADGFDDAWRGRADQLVSLSPMTFPHELARAMLAEQIYRAFATLRGHPYPRIG
jgi:23S rRNA (pseudouridine1915-N3)-methyltransferase